MMTPDELNGKLQSLLRTDYIKGPFKFEGLEVVSKELNEAEDFNTPINSLDQLYFEVVTSQSDLICTPLHRLLSLYRAAGASPSCSVTWNLRRFSLSYAALFVASEGTLFGNDADSITPPGEILVDILLQRAPALFGSFFGDWTEIILRVNGDFETFDGTMKILLQCVMNRVKEAGLLSLQIPTLMTSILGAMFQIPEIVAFTLYRSDFFFQSDEEKAFGVEDAKKSSLLGGFWALAVDAPENFEAMQSLLPPGYAPPLPLMTLQSAFNTLREAQGQMIQLLHEAIFLPLIRGNSENRDRVIGHLAALALINGNRAKLQADRATINSDGFMMNGWWLMLRLCDPFTLAPPALQATKLSLIDVDFCFSERGGLLKWDGEVARAAMDPKEYEEFINSRRDAASIVGSGAAGSDGVAATAQFNFITQILFLSLQYFKLGPARLIQEYGSTSREFNEIEQELKRLEESRASWAALPNAPMIMRFTEKLKGRMRELVDLRISFDFHLINPQLKRSTMALISFFFKFYEALRQNNSSHPLVARAIPEFFFEVVWEYLLFMSRVDPNIFKEECSDADRDVIFQLAAELLPAQTLVKNPYIRAKQVELFFSLISDEQQQSFQLLETLPPAIHQALVPNMMIFYVQVEALGTSTAFYDKFSIRYHLSRVFLKLLALNPMLFALDRLRATLDDGAFVRFINLLVSDATYLLDESMSKLAEIKERQVQIASGQQLSSEEQKLLSQTERQCQSLLALGSESLSFLNQLTAVLPEPFLRSEILDRLTAMLNFNLVILAGPRCSKLKVSNPGKYHFNPRALLSILLSIYLSLAGEDRFVRSVGADERSFSPQLFDSCSGIMRRTGMADEMIDAFTAFSRRVISQSGHDSHETGGVDGVSYDAEEVPEDFLDPILFTLMTDPVLLPASKMIVDRATIQAHLLNDPHDPFNRQSLTMEEVEPEMELKTRIEEFLRGKRQ